MAYVLQIACIALLAETLLRLVPVASAGFRYAYWRLVLAGALVAPWVLRAPPSAAQLPADVAVVGPTAVVFTQASEVATALTESATGWLPLLPWMLAAGTIARLLWVTAGIARLRALRRSSVPVADAAYDEIQQRLGTHAELRSAHISQPVTFGVWRPVVLLPVTLDECAPTIRQAAVTHELIHVHRRDWLFVIAEEALRAVLWFHPAIWWMTARIRLTREEYTDYLAVLVTGSRRSYMEALLAFADSHSLEPAPAFIRRSHLFHRIVLLSKESVMTSRRLVVSGITLTILLGAGSWYASEAFPILMGRLSPVPSAAGAASQATAQAQPANPTTPDNPIPRRLAATPIGYPLVLAGSGFESAVSVRVVVNANGFVESVQAGARAVSAPRRDSAPGQQEAMERFAAAAAEAIGQWHYEPPARAPIAFYVGVLFKPGMPATVSESRTPFAVLAGPDGARIALSVSGFMETELVQAGTATGRSASAGPQGRGGQAAGATQGGAVGGPLETLRVAPPPPPPPPPPGGAVRIGGGIRAPMQTRKVNPVYPAIAQSARVQGVVILEAIIDEEGRVTSARVLRSIPLLDQAAIDAVRQWEYTPTLLNGAPTPVIMTVTVQFKLEEPAPQN